jgi:hypothetical protein
MRSLWSAENEMSPLSVQMTRLLLALAFLTVGTGCNLDTYEFGEKGGWVLPDASTDDGGPEVDADIDACVS